MKIVHIAPPWIAIPPQNYGGTEIVLYNLIEEQVAQGHDVTLIAPDDACTSAHLVSFLPQSLLATGVPWHAHLKAYYHFHKAFEYIKTQRFDVVHTHLSSSADMYIFPLMARMLTPVITTLHSRFPFDRYEMWTGDADDYYLEFMKNIPIVAISESAFKEVPYALNLAGIVHHGLPLDKMRPTTRHPEQFLLWLGRMVPEKGAHLAIHVARELNMPLILAGTIDKHVPSSVKYFAEEIEPQLDNQLIRYVGPVNMREKLDLMSRAQVLLNPIEWAEPFGMVMIEAMAVGCPVIAFARGAAPEIIVAGENGFLVENTQEMVQAVAQISTLDRARVRAYALQHFSVQVMVEKYTRIYKRVIASSLLESSRPRVAATIPFSISLPPRLTKKVEPATTLDLYQPARRSGEDTMELGSLS